MQRTTVVITIGRPNDSITMKFFIDTQTTQASLLISLGSHILTLYHTHSGTGNTVT